MPGQGQVADPHRHLLVPLARAPAGPGGPLRPGGRPVQVGQHLFVGGLGEIPVPLAHRVGPLGDLHAHELVDVAGQALDGLAGGHRGGQHHPFGPVGPGHEARRPGRRPRGDPVVDHDDGPAGERDQGATPAQAPHPVLELGPLPALDGGELGLGDPGLGHHLVVDDEHPSLAERPHRQFGLEGDPKLAHDQDVERGVQGQGHLVGHGNPAPGEADDDHVVRLQVDQRRGQLAAGVLTVTEAVHGAPPTSTVPPTGPGE